MHATKATIMETRQEFERGRKCHAIHQVHWPQGILSLSLFQLSVYSREIVIEQLEVLPLGYKPGPF